MQFGANRHLDLRASTRHSLHLAPHVGVQGHRARYALGRQVISLTVNSHPTPSTRVSQCLLLPQLSTFSTIHTRCIGNRKLLTPCRSKELQPIPGNQVDLHAFVKKSDAEGKVSFYLGEAESTNAQQSTMAGKDDAPLDVVTMELEFDSPIERGLYDYLVDDGVAEVTVTSR